MGGDRAWEEIVTEVASLREMIVWGNGKDCDLVMSLSDGRRLELPVAGVSVLSDGAVRVDVDGPGDSSLRVRYSGPRLEVRSARVGISDASQEETAEFREAVRNWRSGEGCLWRTVDAEITLASAGADEKV